MSYHPPAVSCTGKLGYATASGAHDTMRRMAKRDKFKTERGRHLNVYRCKICRQWHVGGSSIRS